MPPHAVWYIRTPYINTLLALEPHALALCMTSIWANLSSLVSLAELFARNDVSVAFIP